MNMNEFFVFPFKFQDLLEETSDSRYRVTSDDIIENMDERRIVRILNEIEKAVYEDFTMIREPDRFDFLFHWIKHLETKKEDYPIELLENTADLLSSCLENVLKHIEICADAKNSSPGEIDEMRNSFKMLLFLLFFFLSNTRVKFTKNSLKEELSEAVKNNQKDNKRKDNKGSKKRKVMNNENLERLTIKQRNCLKWLEMSIQTDLKFLWNKRSIDDEFYKYFAETCQRLMESRIILREQNAKQTIFKILEIVLSRQPEALRNIQIRLINLVYEDENIVEPIADFVIKAYKSGKENMIKLSTDTLSLLVTFVTEKTNVNNESQAVKNTKDFLCKVSDEMPKLFYTNLSSFISLYDSEAYHLRNALSEILGNIVKNVLTIKGEDEDHQNMENYESKKRKLLEKLLCRIFDKHAHCRSHVLNVLCTLCQENVVPNDFLNQIFVGACDRIKDISAFVRRKAIQLISVLVNIYFAIFVKSQNRKKFMTLEEIENEINFCENDIKDTEKELHEIEDEIKKGQRENEEILNLQKDHHDLVRKKEQSSQTKNKLKEYRQFLRVIDEIMPNLVQLLGSKNQFDVVETIKLLISLNKYNVQSSEVGVRKMLVLIWSKEKTIREELVKAYWSLYLNDSTYDSKTIARNLVNLQNQSTLTEATSLEELLMYILDWNNQIEEKDREKKKNMYYISDGPIKSLWDLFFNGINGFNERGTLEARSALQLLRIIFSKKKEAMHNKMEVFEGILDNYRKNKNPDWIVIKEISLILEKSGEISKRTTNILKTLIFCIIFFHGTSNTEWYCASEKILTTIFTISSQPEVLCKYILLRLTKHLYQRTGSEFSSQENENLQFPPSPSFKQEKCHSPLKTPGRMEDERQIGFEDKLAQTLFLVGHISIKFLIYIDSIENRLKKMKNEAETKLQADQKDGANEDLDKIHGGLEAEFDKRVEILHSISEYYLIERNLISSYIPWVKQICDDLLDGKGGSGRNEILDRVAVLTLCKFMCTSSEFCKQNLERLFRFLNSRHIDSVTKHNVIISLGDLMHRYPNITEPFTFRLYQNLQCEDSNVRKTTLMVITHLVLNDMLKIKGEISDIALLYQDPDPKIQSLVKLFMSELHKKDPKIIYNLLPEAISRMSRLESDIGEEMIVDENNFQIFARNIMPFLEKEKYSETLVEKLCSRFKNSQNQKEWRNSAFCLSLLAYNEKSFRKLIEMFENYREKLKDPRIMECFRNIQAKFKKNSKQELKLLVDEFESKLGNFADESSVINEERRKVAQPPGKKGRGRRGNNGEMVEETKSDIDDKENRVYSQDIRTGSNTKKLGKSKTTGFANNKKKKRLGRVVDTNILDDDDFIEEEDENDEHENGIFDENDEQSGSKPNRTKKIIVQGLASNRPKRNVNRRNMMEVESDNQEIGENSDEEYV